MFTSLAHRRTASTVLNTVCRHIVKYMESTLMVSSLALKGRGCQPHGALVALMSSGDFEVKMSSAYSKHAFPQTCVKEVHLVRCSPVHESLTDPMNCATTLLAQRCRFEHFLQPSEAKHLLTRFKTKDPEPDSCMKKMDLGTKLFSA